ncbi:MULTISPECIES: phage major capsid protein [unclassified Paracoccus (in: a-proteobacteria)]|uniref:phage major capsid protein n=1 Tax=unclassified Paracoccus (in: a-proteobacteria) TaxID=2688777 RepID=UPI0012B437FD|nr:MULTISPECIES: phage major capsid protein [unclassified Paracoccus (in: a-proteobacteria)]UXU73699.1 phage major capsid protein [Paracoccus sp. SMMA_5]UXU79589.1 phage major capsid protein [Paracoccus sp. SMMA_5_TC]
MSDPNPVNPVSAALGGGLVRSVTAEQINARMRSADDFRHRGEVRGVDLESRIVELAFSSETPVQRWFGDEVLDHSPGSIRMQRLQGGAALLVNHDWDDQIGVVESVEIGADRRARAKVRFGRSARADEILKDVADGIRRHVSFGYVVHAIQVETRPGQPDLVRVTDWEPYEISLVSVPADPTVGVGRAAEIAPEERESQSDHHGRNRAVPAHISGNEGSSMKKKLQRNATGQLVWVEIDENGAVLRELEVVEEAGAERGAGEAAERSRVNTILELGRQYDAADLAQAAIRDGRSIDQFRAAVLEQLSANRRHSLTDGDGGIGLTDQEVRRFSFMRLFRALADPTDRALQEAAAFEFECARAAEERSHRSPKGTLIPIDVLTRALNTGTGGANLGDTGGVLVATELMSQSFVDMLRNRATLMRLGTPMGGLIGNIDIPTQTGGASGYWIGEDEEAVLSAMAFGQFGLRPKTVAGMTEITRRLLMQSSLDVEALARRDLATALALTVDKAGYYGSGSDHQPRGIMRTDGVNAVDFGTDGGGAGIGQMPSYADIVEMESQIAAENADVDSMAYVFNARMRGHFKTTPKFMAGTDQGVIWEPGQTVNGYRCEVTNQIANGDVIFGNFADLLIGMWGGLDVTVDPFTHSARGRVRIVMMQDVDIAVRRPQSFCLGRDITA